LGMIFYMLRSRSSGSGVKLASGSISISILSSWTIMASNVGFSPCEAYLNLLLLSAIVAPAKMALFDVDSLVGEGVGLLAVFVTELWLCAAYGWLFARLYRVLPLLGTENVTFFFARVSLDGWFRIFMLVLCVLMDWPSTIWWSIKVIRALRVLIAVYRRGASEMTKSEREEANIYDLKGTVAIPQWWTKFVRRGVPIFLWIYSVTTVETTITWNHLSPSTELTSPGQLIPLVTGIIIFIDGLQVLLRRQPTSTSNTV
jgi:hypothetical protein